jgi:hypothetical protein
MQSITAAANFRRKIFKRLHIVCYLRTLSNVCWSFVLVANNQNCFWCFIRNAVFTALELNYILKLQLFLEF